MQIQPRSRAPGPPYNSRTRSAAGSGRETLSPARSPFKRDLHEFKGKVFIRHRGHRTGVHTDANSTPPEGPSAQDPLTTAVLDQPPGRAAERLAPPGRLKRVLDKAHLHLGDLLPDPLRVAHLRSRSEQLRVVYEERLGAQFTGKVFISAPEFSTN